MIFKRLLYLLKLYMDSCVRRGGSVVSASDLGSEGREFEFWFIRVVFIGKTLKSHTASPPPGVKVGSSNMGGNVGKGNL